MPAAHGYSYLAITGVLPMSTGTAEAKGSGGAHHNADEHEIDGNGPYGRLPAMNDFVRAIIWENPVLRSMEHCRFSRSAGGWLISGQVIAGLDPNQPMLATYHVRTDDEWKTRYVSVERTIGDDRRSLTLDVTDGASWHSKDGELRQIDGCLDVDLACSPATNTLPIRRLNLGNGEAQVATTAWIRFPGLEVQPLRQTYTRLSADRYRYESATGFSAEIVVDDLGMVVDYVGGWRRLASR
jgi:hypothetical protein